MEGSSSVNLHLACSGRLWYHCCVTCSQHLVWSLQKSLLFSFFKVALFPNSLVHN